jgi:hypothetical protein
MGSTLKRDESDAAGRLLLRQEPPGVPATDVRDRQAAASYLQASALTDDPVTRDSLRRRAAALLAHRLGEERGCSAC